MELNAENIRVALRCHADEKNKCAICPYNKESCSIELAKDAIALINSQEQKIFALENRLKECENGYKGTNFLDRCKLHDAEEKVKELTEENERLRAIIDEAKKRVERLAEITPIAFDNKINEAKTETVLKMQEWLNAHFDSNCAYFRISHDYIRRDIDKIAKEMLEDKLCT